MRLGFVFVLLLASTAAHAAGSEQVSWTIGAGGWQTVSNSGTYLTQSIRYSKMTIRERPVQFLIYGGYRSQDTGRHTFHELDIGFGGRWLPRRPLSYAGDSAIRLTASGTFGWSLATFDFPLELSAGLAFCGNRGKFNGMMMELAFRPAPESLKKQSNSVGTPGTPGVVDLGPWAGLRFTGFW